MEYGSTKYLVSPCNIRQQRFSITLKLDKHSTLQKNEIKHLIGYI